MRNRRWDYFKLRQWRGAVGGDVSHSATDAEGSLRADHGLGVRLVQLDQSGVLRAGADHHLGNVASEPGAAGVCAAGSLDRAMVEPKNLGEIVREVRLRIHVFDRVAV